MLTYDSGVRAIIRYPSSTLVFPRRSRSREGSSRPIENREPLLPRLGSSQNIHSEYSEYREDLDKFETLDRYVRDGVFDHDHSMRDMKLLT